MFPSPTIVPPTLEDFQWSYAGLVFGANTPWGVLHVEGLGLAELRHQNAPWPRDHGEALGLDVFGGRQIIFDLWDVAGGTSLQARQLELAAATNILPNSEEYLWFKLPELDIMCVPCRVSKRPTTIDSDYAAANVAKPELAFTATDPRIYSAGKEQEIQPGETVTVTNDGNTEMRPIVYFNGPSVKPAMENSTLGADLGFITGPGLPEVKTGDQLFVSLGIPHLIEYYKGKSSRIFLGGGENVSEWLANDAVWWDLPPGDSDIFFHPNSGAGTAVIQWASAYEL